MATFFMLGRYSSEALKGISDKMEDILIYAVYPMTGLEFLKKKYKIQ